ncbi:MAG: hypothetical protein WCR31_03215 [Treponema sp.]
MLALTGTYDNGKVTFAEKPPVTKGRIIVLFPESFSEKKLLSVKEKEALFKKFSGYIDRDIDVKAERLTALDERT